MDGLGYGVRADMQARGDAGVTGGEADKFADGLDVGGEEREGTS